MSACFEAITRAAEHIEQHGELLKIYGYDEIPTRADEPACAVGWIGYFAQMSGHIENVAREFLGVELEEVSVRLHDLTPEPKEYWFKSGSLCARTLRRYARKYHAGVEGE